MHLEDSASRAGAATVSAPMKASTGKADSKKVTDFQVHIPKSLADAIKIEGEREVFKRYLQSLAIAIQANKRMELGDEGEKAPRKRAGYLESVGL